MTRILLIFFLIFPLFISTSFGSEPPYLLYTNINSELDSHIKTYYLIHEKTVASAGFVKPLKQTFSRRYQKICDSGCFKFFEYESFILINHRQIGFGNNYVLVVTKYYLNKPIKRIFINVGSASLDDTDINTLVSQLMSKKIVLKEGEEEVISSDLTLFEESEKQKSSVDEVTEDISMVGINSDNTSGGTVQQVPGHFSDTVEKTEESGTLDFLSWKLVTGLGFQLAAIYQYTVVSSHIEDINSANNKASNAQTQEEYDSAADEYNNSVDSYNESIRLFALVQTTAVVFFVWHYFTHDSNSSTDPREQSSFHFLANPDQITFNFSYRY